MPKTISNPMAKVLFSHSGNAGAAISVDTRPKVVKAGKGRGSYNRNDKHRRRCDN